MRGTNYKDFINMVVYSEPGEYKFRIYKDRAPRKYEYEFALRFIIDNRYVDNIDAKIEGKYFIIKK